jgi:hypothetical protein
MNTRSNTGATPSFNDFVATDFLALQSHMNACQRAGGKLFRVRFLLETLHALAAPRIVTSGAVVLACGIALSILA